MEAKQSEWSDEEHGAWAAGKAPLSLLTSFLAHIQAHETAEAVDTARQILGSEPENALVKDLMSALMLQEAMEREAEKEEEDDEEEGEDDEEDGEEDEDGSGEDDSEEDDEDDENDNDDDEPSDKSCKDTPEDDDHHEEK